MCNERVRKSRTMFSGKQLLTMVVATAAVFYVASNYKELKAAMKH